MGLFRRKAIAELEAKVEEAKTAQLRMEKHRLVLRDRLLCQERDFPARKRELVDEMLPFVQSLVAGQLDWAAPVIERTQAEAEIRRLLAAIGQVEPDPAHPNALGGAKAEAAQAIVEAGL